MTDWQLMYFCTANQTMEWTRRSVTIGTDSSHDAAVQSSTGIEAVYKQPSSEKCEPFVRLRHPTKWFRLPSGRSVWNVTLTPLTKTIWSFSRPITTKLLPKLPVLQSVGMLLTGAISACATATSPTRRGNLTIASPPRLKRMPVLPSKATGIIGMLSTNLPTSVQAASRRCSTIGLPKMSFRPLMPSKSGFTGSKEDLAS